MHKYKICSIINDELNCVERIIFLQKNNFRNISINATTSISWKLVEDFT